MNLNCNNIPESPALAHCYREAQHSYQVAIDEGNLPQFAERDAAKAYRRALPLLSGAENIRDFIACVTHGMLIGAIDANGGTKLLYAAQIAHATGKKQASPPPSGAK